MNIKSRVDKLHTQSISDVTSIIVVKKDKKIIAESKSGTNNKKVVAIVLEL